MDAQGKKSSADDIKKRFEMAQTEFQEQEAEMCRVQFEVKLMQGELEQYTKVRCKAACSSSG